ncbi:hypothetical protein NHX12_017141 [Muraenolepis orangiensis]|uniref:Uncharacterized protein n=1 Tax=Muraenolepis orangiensis TaxID=630683 RepID=A0A9Q0D4Z6_9TELE|nr:hypothetical protein NHX12_017141 [Muraenolepis orangiensis]
MSEEISKVVKQQVDIMELMKEVCELKATINQRDQKIELMEQRIDDLEQYSRIDDIVISGLETTHRSYARAAAGDRKGEDAPTEEQHSLEQQVLHFFNSKVIPLDSRNLFVTPFLKD